jgi:hypothetical protein
MTGSELTPSDALGVFYYHTLANLSTTMSKNFDPTALLTSLKDFTEEIYLELGETYITYKGLSAFVSSDVIDDWLYSPTVSDYLTQAIDKSAYTDMINKRRLNSTIAATLITHILIDVEAVHLHGDPRVPMFIEVMIAAGLRLLAETRFKVSQQTDLPSLVLRRIDDAFIVDLVACTAQNIEHFNILLSESNPDFWTATQIEGENKWTLDSTQMNFREIINNDFQAIARVMGVRYKNLL